MAVRPDEWADAPWRSRLGERCCGEVLAGDSRRATASQRVRTWRERGCAGDVALGATRPRTATSATCSAIASASCRCRRRNQFWVASSPASSVRAASRGVDRRAARPSATPSATAPRPRRRGGAAPPSRRGSPSGDRWARRWISLMSNGKPHRASTSSRTRRWSRSATGPGGGPLPLDDGERDAVHPLEDRAEDLGLGPEPVVDRRLLQARPPRRSGPW